MKNKVPQVFVVGFLLCVLFAGDIRSADLIDNEKATKIKAAYLYHLVRLVEWPDEVLSELQDSLRIIVVGADPNDISGLFTAQARTVGAHEHPLTIIHLRDSAEFLSYLTGDPDKSSHCHLLHFLESEVNSYEVCLGRIQIRHTLTTSEIDGFSSSGGMVGFVIRGNRVAIEVNQQAIRYADLKISAEFLQHAKIVEGVFEQGGLD
ncbi:MAG: YfiR family protein [bacterium]|nr:YfiR family protein [bacterium]